MANTLTPKAPTFIKREEKRYRPRVARAMIRLSNRLRRSVSRNELEKALETGNVSKVMELFSDKRTSTLYGPLVGILTDALARAGRAAARELP